VNTIIETIQEIIRHELKSMRVAELGLVEAVYPHSTISDNDNYGCDVRLKNSGLLLRRVPLSTGRIGTVAAPNKGDLVMLAFVGGDINQPIVMGRMYNDIDRPPLSSSDEVVFRLPLAGAEDESIKAAVRNTRSKSPPREMLIEMPPNIRVLITDGSVRATAGKTEMLLDQPGGSQGRVTVIAGSTKIIMNQDGDVSVEAAGSITLKAKGDLNLEGKNVSIKGQMKAKLEAGTQASLKAGMGATVDGGLSTTIQGTTASIKGLTSFLP
jgi:phage baseplate assembly protein gpV